jgi:Rrf2 family protein
MKISKKSQYGLRSLVLLAKKDFLPLRVISEKENIPFDYLEKIFSKLEKNHLVQSKKGSQGGYSLARNSKKITVGQIIRALEGEIVLVECIGCSRKKSCPTINVWEKLQDSLEKTIDSITLKELIK